MFWRQVVSQSPASTSQLDEARDSDSAYRRSLKNVNEQMKNGGSFSGHERNCTFLNLQGESFATISAVSRNRLSGRWTWFGDERLGWRW